MLVTKKLKVDGMSCQHCVRRVEKALGAQPGVSKVTVDLAASTATVDYDDAIFSPNAAITAVADAGYQAVWMDS